MGFARNSPNSPPEATKTSPSLSTDSVLMVKRRVFGGSPDCTLVQCVPMHLMMGDAAGPELYGMMGSPSGRERLKKGRRRPEQGLRPAATGRGWLVLGDVPYA